MSASSREAARSGVKFSRRALAIGLVATSGLRAGRVQAEAFPTHLVKIVIPISAGSATDVVGRLFAEGLRVELGQPFIVENRPGAGGSIGSASVAKAPADGYTLLIASSAHTANPALYSNLPFDTAADFRGISMLATLPLFLVVAASKGINSVADLVALAKAKPGQLTYGSSGVGGALHMGAEKFRSMAGFEALHVPYRGTPEVLADLMAGRVDFAFIPIGNAAPGIEDRRLVALASGGERRSRMLPNVPTTVEAGVPGSTYAPWVGFFAPAGTPPSIVEKLNHAVVRAAQTAEVVERLAAVGAEPATMSPSAFDAYIKKDLVATKELVRFAKIPVN